MNTNMHLVSCKECLEEIVQKSQALCTKYADSDPKLADAVSHFQRIYKERIGDLNPKIMIYGIYNAGKSTLINALVGKNVAEMNDVPTTVKVTPYQWNEYTIFDTPGINAPKKDEEVSKEQLEKSDVIIFVMDTEGAFSLGKNYRELVDIVNDKKRLLIVLNNKSGLDMQNDVDQIEKIKSQIYRDFAELYGSLDAKQLAQRFKLIVVNAQDALVARTTAGLSADDVTALIESSNIEALESAIIEEYSQASGLTVLAQLAQQLKGELASVSKLLQSREGDKLSAKGFETFEKVQKQQEALYNKVRDYAQDKAAVLKDDVYHVLTTAKDSDSARVSIQKAVAEVAEQVNRYLNEEAVKMAQRIDRDLSDFSAVVSSSVEGIEVAPSPENINIDTADVSDGTSSPSNKDQLVSTTAAAALAQPLIKKGITAALPLIKTIPFVGPMVAPILPAVVPVLLAVMAFKALFGGNDREKAEEAKMRQYEAQLQAQVAQQQERARRMQECVEESARIARKLLSNLLDAFRERVAALFEPALAQVQDTIAASRSKSAEIIDDMRAVSQLEDELSRLVANLS